MGVASLTLYAFSVENWKRPRAEVRYLMRLLRRYLVDERPTLMENGVRLRAIGRTESLPDDSLRALRETEEITRENDGLVLRLALSYGARTELGDAIKALAREVSAGKLDVEAIDEETIRNYLYDPEMPDPDLLIRTAGELRLSNFLLWQISYSEIYIAEVCWPHFRRPELMIALRDYAGRVRKYGGLVSDRPTPRAASAARERRA